MGDRYTWKIADSDLSKPDAVLKELRVHGRVYQLVKKGFLLDKPMNCYASFSRGRSSILLQFGNSPVVSNLRDNELLRLRKLSKMHAFLGMQGIPPEELIYARADDEQPDIKDSFFLNLKRFVETYCRA